MAEVSFPGHVLVSQAKFIFFILSGVFSVFFFFVEKLQ